MDPQRLQEELKKTRRELRILYEIGNLMRTTLLMDEVMYLILSVVTSHEGLGYNRAILFLLDESGRKLEGRMGIGPAHPETSPIVWKMIEENRITLEGLLDVYRKAGKRIDEELNAVVREVRIPVVKGAGSLARAILENSPVLVPAAKAAEELGDDGLRSLEIGQFAAIPLRGKDDRPIGVLTVDNVVTKLDILEHDARRIRMLADHAGLALENAKSYREAVITAQQDSLTKLWNHGHFQRLLQDALRDARERQGVLSLLIFDVDDFKKYNDTHGHPAGDEALREIARAARGTMRKGDQLARYGGEEFAAILPRATKEEAAAVAEKLREAVEGSARGGGPGMTVSIGAASYPADCEDKEKLIYCADAALYEAKRSGKNRVVTYRNPA